MTQTNLFVYYKYGKKVKVTTV